jgi:hypothetical protein
MALEYASDELKNNEEIFLSCVLKCGRVFQFASQELKKNKKLMKKCLDQSSTYKNIPIELFSDYGFMNDLLKNSKFLLFLCLRSDLCQHFPKELLDDEHIVSDLIPTTYCSILEFISDRLKKNKEFMMGVLKKFPNSIKYFPLEYQADFDIMSGLIQINPYLLSYASDDLKDNPEIVNQATSKDIFSLCYASDNYRLNYEYLIKTISKSDIGLRFFLNLASYEPNFNKTNGLLEYDLFKTYIDILKINPNYYQFIEYEFKSNNQILYLATFGDCFLVFPKYVEYSELEIRKSNLKIRKYLYHIIFNLNFYNFKFYDLNFIFEY